MAWTDLKRETLPIQIRQLEKKIQHKKVELEAVMPNEKTVIDKRRVEQIQAIKLECLLLENECYSLKKFYLLTCSSKSQFKKEYHSVSKQFYHE